MFRSTRKNTGIFLAPQVISRPCNARRKAESALISAQSQRPRQHRGKIRLRAPFRYQPRLMAADSSERKYHFVSHRPLIVPAPLLLLLLLLSPHSSPPQIYLTAAMLILTTFPSIILGSKKILTTPTGRPGLMKTITLMYVVLTTTVRWVRIGKRTITRSRMRPRRCVCAGFFLTCMDTHYLYRKLPFFPGSPIARSFSMSSFDTRAVAIGRKRRFAPRATVVILPQSVAKTASVVDQCARLALSRATEPTRFIGSK